jgi:hypothetical protein
MLQSDSANALIELKALAESGSIMSMVYLGDAYKLGKGTKIDLSRAEEWYRRAADKGSLLGSYSLGRLYFRLKRYVEAKNAFSVAAARDYIPAVHFLGRMYASGKGVEKDSVKAEQLLERASKNGSVLAKGVLAYLLTHGHLSPLRFLRGMWLYLGMWVDLFIVVCTEGRTSDRLR